MSPSYIDLGVSPEFDRIRHLLTELGMQEAEVEAVLSLAVQGPTSAPELAERTRMSRATAYRTLSHLVQEGLVQVVLERPMTYAVLPPQDLFAVLEDQLRERKELIEEFRGSWGPTVQERRRGATGTADGTRLQVVHGRRQSYEFLARIVRAARFSLDVCSLQAEAPYWAHRMEIFPVLEEMVEVDMRIVWQDTPANRRLLDDLPGMQHLQVRFLDEPQPYRFVLVDDHHVFHSIVTDANRNLNCEREVGVYTEACGLVAADRALFEDVWGRARN